MSYAQQHEYNMAVAFAIEAAKARSWRILRRARVQSIEDWLDSHEGRDWTESEESSNHDFNLEG